jgi:branched-subunit amino acid ABC-type transport system permease component
MSPSVWATYEGLATGITSDKTQLPRPRALEAVYAKVILLGLVILFLQLRPSGLFPAKGRHEDS